MAVPIAPGSLPPTLTPQQNSATQPINQQMLRQTFMAELSRLTSPLSQRPTTPQIAHSPAPSQITFIPLTAACAPTGQAGASTTSRSAQVKKNKNRDVASGPVGATAGKR